MMLLKEGRRPWAGAVCTEAGKDAYHGTDL